MKYLAAILLSIAAPCAIAQDITFSPTPLIECEAEPGEPRNCVGMAMEECWANSADGYSSPVMAACGWAEAGYWQTRLEEAETALSHREEGLVLDQFNIMQSAWRDFREAQCDYFSAKRDTPSSHNAARAGCMIYATAEHVFYLEQRLKE